MDVLVKLAVIVGGAVVTVAIDRLAGYKVEKDVPIFSRITHVVALMAWGALVVSL